MSKCGVCEAEMEPDYKLHRHPNLGMCVTALKAENKQLQEEVAEKDARIEALRKSGCHISCAEEKRDLAEELAEKNAEIERTNIRIEGARETTDCTVNELTASIAEKDAEIKRLNKVCAEFIWAEENPSEHQLSLTASQERVEELEKAIQDYKNAQNWYHSHAINDAEQRMFESLLPTQGGKKANCHIPHKDPMVPVDEAKLCNIGGVNTGGIVPPTFPNSDGAGFIIGPTSPQKEIESLKAEIERLKKDRDGYIHEMAKARREAQSAHCRRDNINIHFHDWLELIAGHMGIDVNADEWWDVSQARQERMVEAALTTRDERIEELIGLCKDIRSALLSSGSWDADDVAKWEQILSQEQDKGGGE